MTRRPLIGLNMSLDMVDKYEKYDLLVPLGYVDSVVGAGGIPFCLPPYPDLTMAQEIIPILDGILFIGGDDYRPEHYGGHPQPDDELIPERRDRFDLALAKLVLQETGLPVLGICGGHQLISIAQDGALVQDIRTEWNCPAGCVPLPHSRKERNDEEGKAFRHSVRLEKDSLIEQVMHIQPGDSLITNSTHHQSVHPMLVGRDLRASAWTEDGVIEVIEPSADSHWSHSGRFVLGVQWHPEQMQDETPHRNLFRALIEAARKK
ncbi:MAG: gamma-glutamyl-gamma-aminobutyrate hydrolase family protein [Syntrophaceae bacterium]